MNVEQVTDQIARFAAQSRHGPGVHMDGSHNPVPSEIREARFIAQTINDEVELELTEARKAAYTWEGIAKEALERHERAKKALSSMKCTCTYLGEGDYITCTRCNGLGVIR